MSGNINNENINDVINSIYDFETINQNMYRIDYIPKHEINMWQYKKHENFNYNNVFEDCKFNFIGIKNNRYVFKRIYNDPNKVNDTLIKIAFYTKDDISDISNKENINLAISYVLGELVITKETNFIHLSLMGFDMPSKDLIPEIIKNINKKDVKEYAQIQIYECFYENCFLNDLLNKALSDELSKALIFQILFVLSKIIEKWPFFKHNGLNIDSFFIYLKKNTEKIKEYYLGSTEFKVVEPRFEIKLCDFQESILPNFIENSIGDYQQPAHLNILNQIKKKLSIDAQNFIDDAVKSKSSPKELLIMHPYFSSYRASTELSRTKINNKYSNNDKNFLRYGYDSMSSSDDLENNNSSSLTENHTDESIHPEDVEGNALTDTTTARHSSNRVGSPEKHKRKHKNKFSPLVLIGHRIENFPENNMFSVILNNGSDSDSELNSSSSGNLSSSSNSDQDGGYSMDKYTTPSHKARNARQLGGASGSKKHKDKKNKKVKEKKHKSKSKDALKSMLKNETSGLARIFGETNMNQQGYNYPNEQFNNYPTNDGNFGLPNMPQGMSRMPSSMQQNMGESLGSFNPNELSNMAPTLGGPTPMPNMMGHQMGDPMQNMMSSLPPLPPQLQSKLDPRVQQMMSSQQGMPQVMGNPMISQSMGNPMISQSMGNPMMNQAMGNPMMNQAMGNPMMNQSMGNPMMNQSMDDPSMKIVPPMDHNIDSDQMQPMRGGYRKNQEMKNSNRRDIKTNNPFFF